MFADLPPGFLPHRLIFRRALSIRHRHGPRRSGVAAFFVIKWEHDLVYGEAVARPPVTVLRRECRSVEIGSEPAIVLPSNRASRSFCRFSVLADMHKPAEETGAGALIGSKPALRR